MLSFGERLLRNYLKKCFKTETVIYNDRSVGIKNPKTNANLELDIFYPNLLVAFEFNGRQHRTDEEQKERDKIKKKECKKLGIDLNKDLYKDIKDKILEHSGFKISKPNLEFLNLFEEKIEHYKKNIKKLHKNIKSDTFVKVVRCKKKRY